MSEALAEPAVEAEAPEPAVEGEQAEPEVVGAPAPQVDVAELQGELEYLRNQNAEIVNYLRSQGVAPAQAQAAANQETGFDPASLVDEYGNLDPGAFAQFLAQRDERLLGAIDQRFQSISAPLAAREEAETIAEGEQRLTDILADDISRNGEFVAGVTEEAKAADKQARELVRTLANQAFPEVAQRYGMTPRAAEVAMTNAATQVRGLLKAAGLSAVAVTANHNATLAGASREAGSGAAGLATTPDGIQRPGAIASRYAASASRIRG